MLQILHGRNDFKFFLFQTKHKGMPSTGATATGTGFQTKQKLFQTP